MAFPSAWKILPGNVKGSWKPYWLELFKNIEKGIADDWFVIVTTDRGLYASWFYQAIQQAGWHPFMRIKSQGSFRQGAMEDWKPLKGLISDVGVDWSGQVTCFRTNPIECTLLGRWESGHADPWLIVTDLEPKLAQICWYSMRCWIECLFKDIKRGGFGWHNTKMTDPKRAERLWLAIAVATLWLVSVGSNTDRKKSPSPLEEEKVHITYSDAHSLVTTPTTPVLSVSSTVADDDSSASELTNTPTLSVSSTVADDDSSASELTNAPTLSVSSTVAVDDGSSASELTNTPTLSVSSIVGAAVEQIIAPTLSCFRRGFITILAALLKGHPIPTGQFIPDFPIAPG